MPCIPQGEERSRNPVGELRVSFLHPRYSRWYFYRQFSFISYVHTAVPDFRFHVLPFIAACFVTAGGRKLKHEYGGGGGPPPHSPILISKRRLNLPVLNGMFLDCWRAQT